MVNISDNPFEWDDSSKHVSTKLRERTFGNGGRIIGDFADS